MRRYILIIKADPEKEVKLGELLSKYISGYKVLECFRNSAGDQLFTVISVEDHNKVDLELQSWFISDRRLNPPYPPGSLLLWTELKRKP